MLTLADIDALYPHTHDGSVFSDLHKEAYGYRPRGSQCEFRDIEHFEEVWQDTQKVQERVMEEEAEQQARCKADFITRIEALQAEHPEWSVAKCAYEHALSADIRPEDLEFYGWETVEYHFNLPYGSLAKLTGEAG